MVHHCPHKEINYRGNATQSNPLVVEAKQATGLNSFDTSIINWTYRICYGYLKVFLA